MPSKTKLNIPQEKPGKTASWFGILGLVSFSTILPLNYHPHLQDVARFTWMWPFVGGFIGIIVGFFGFLLVDVVHLNQLVAAALIYSFTIWFTGFHHLDGLIDFGDGLMAHGSPQRRIEIMRDQRIGTGGLAYFFMVALITFAALTTIPAGYILLFIFIAEIAAKLGLITCCTFSDPLQDGTGRFFIEGMNLKLLLLSLAITLLVGFLTLNLTGILGIVGGLVGGIIMVLVAKIKFEKTNGDILGATNEISRMLALIFMTAVSTGLL
jgi:adenosylcobinamide-GDP ribazoletransferase